MGMAYLIWVETSLSKIRSRLQVLDYRNIFENLNARSALRDPLRNTADWPRRLLNVPSMISKSRLLDSTMYDDVQSPSYNILSYTWGRYAIPAGPALNVSNVSWQIPPIDGEIHFTVAQFAHIVGCVADPSFVGKAENESGDPVQTNHPRGAANDLGDTCHLWLDVACIDQGSTNESQTLRMEEIGKQIMIFGRAETAYVWLSHHKADELASILSELGTVALKFETIFIPTDIACHPTDGTWEQWLEQATSSFERLLADPWFTSLWTFQEAFLRQDAILLSLEAQPIAIEPQLRTLLGEKVKQRDLIVGREDYDLYSKAIHGRYWTVATLAAIFSWVHSTVLFVLRASNVGRETVVGIRLRNLLDLLTQSGIVHLASTNPFALYHATKFRKTSRREDRVFGCMQIFNVRIGYPSTLFRSDATYNELNGELALWLINRHGPNSQMFVHTKPTELGKRWRFTLDCVVTDDFMPQMFRSYEMYLGFWVARSRSWGLRFNGIAYDFEALAVRWSTPSKCKPCQSEIELSLCLDRPSIGALEVIALDECDLLGDVPAELRSLWLDKNERNLLVDWIKQHVHNRSVKVLLLGHFIAGTGPNYYCMGIIVLRQNHNEHGQLWTRIGLCLWVSNLVPLRGECDDGKWHHLSGLYA